MKKTPKTLKLLFKDRRDTFRSCVYFFQHVMNNRNTIFYLDRMSVVSAASVLFVCYIYVDDAKRADLQKCKTVKTLKKQIRFIKIMRTNIMRMLGLKNGEGIL